MKQDFFLLPTRNSLVKDKRLPERLQFIRESSSYWTKLRNAKRLMFSMKPSCQIGSKCKFVKHQLPASIFPYNME